MLWNKNFSLLVAANVLLYMAVYLLYPLLHSWLMVEWGCTPLQAAVTVGVFAPAMFLLGAFNNYWVDRYPRKSVAMRSLLVIGAVNLLYPHVGTTLQVGGLRLLQGAAFGVAVMATGATLAIDVTPGNRRTPANRVFAWSCIVGSALGLIAALLGGGRLSMEQLLYVSSALCLAGMILVSLVEVCFRAPLDVPVCSFDRFLLFRSLPAGLNMLVVPFVLGVLLVAVPDASFYFSTAVGFLGYVLVRQLYTRPMNGRLQVFIGQLFVIAGLLALTLYASTPWILYSGAFCIGLGSGFSIGQFLRMMILLPHHCERASGFQTYLLLWETGILLGMLAACLPEANSLALAFIVAVVGLLVYQLYLHDYFVRHVDTPTT